MHTALTVQDAVDGTAFDAGLCMAQVGRPSPRERKAFARRLNAALDRGGKSRKELASDLGVSYGAVGAWLRAESDCPVGWVAVIAAKLGIPACELVEDTPTGVADDGFARRVIEVLESPLTAPDLMELLAAAKQRLSA